MPYEFNLDMPPAGHAVTAAGPGETVCIAATEFTSTEDGQHFIQRVEGFPEEILSRIAANGPRFNPATVDHLLAVIRHDGTKTFVTAYVNELKLTALIRAGRDINKGDSVFRNDIVDIQSFHIEGVDIPPGAGVLFLFSVGWRKGLFYDFRPLPPVHHEIDYDLENAFGQFYAYVMFQERFAISELEWASMFDAGWFPFNSLKQETSESIIAYLRNDWDQAALVDLIADNVADRIENFRDCWQTQKVFSDHSALLTHALDRFIDHDFISCVSILYPRIEGLLRSFHSSIGSEKRPSQKNLAESAVDRYAPVERCLLLPRKFREYLESVYFQAFNPQNSDITCSRNSVGHGVASQECFNQQAAIVGILVVQQLFYFFSDSAKRIA